MSKEDNDDNKEYKVFAPEKIKNVTSSIQLNIDNKLYRIFLTLDEITRFICKKTGYIFTKC